MTNLLLNLWVVAKMLIAFCLVALVNLFNVFHYFRELETECERLREHNLETESRMLQRHRIKFSRVQTMKELNDRVNHLG